MTSFEQWIKWMFDHPVTKTGWHWDKGLDEAEDHSLPPELGLEFATRVLSDPESHLSAYDEGQVEQGLLWMASETGSEIMDAVKDLEVPWPVRRDCVRSVYTLYEQYFASHCSPHLGHLAEPGASPLNNVCYMWWDYFPTWGKPEEPGYADLDAEILDVMAKTLEIDSDPCREGALHGLSHWHLTYPKKTATIIDLFLRRHGQPLRPELVEYAKAARDGAVQ